jgi:ribonuclease R
VDRVIPMLPAQLSADACTLKPNVDRLTVSVQMELDQMGKVVTHDIAEAVIQSRARLTYEQVQQILDGAPTSEQQDPTELREHLLAMRGLSKMLTQKRLRRGALDFDLPEAKVVLDAQTGAPIDIHPEERLESHRIIEEFMLLANETVAQHMLDLDIPFLYRVHDKPDQAKMGAFIQFAKSLGYALRTKGPPRPDAIQCFLKETRGKPEEYLLNDLLLRSMKRALYTPENIGHFGLASPVYTHFTSPIRRYPDLLVHRLLKASANGPMNEARRVRLCEWLPGAGEAASERERVADEAERESVKVKQVQFMESRVGESCWGITSGVRPFGFFVQLDRFLVDGLVHVATLGDDYYHFDESQSTLVGERWHRVFRVGDRVRVQVVRADKASKQVDFVLLEHNGRSAEQGGKKAVKRRRRR